ncbi:MAG TPA: hypothetical protein VJ870_17250 [Amycolatopsis sp.]|nr:hypothetical protein [Amycolatopsis sp.]
MVAWPAWLDVVITAALLVVFGVTGWGFTRRTLRIAALTFVLTGALLAYFRLVAAPPDWPVFLGALVLGYLGSEMLAARREPPGVDVASPLEHDNAETKELLTELGFRLPAVTLRRPAAAPGGSSGDQVASIVEASDARGSALAAAVIRLAEKVMPLPRRYVVRLRAERCDASEPQLVKTTDPLLWMTVDVRDHRSNASIAVTTFSRTKLSDAAEHAAAFVAATVLRGDPATPGWLVPARERADDLAKFLLGPPSPAVGASYQEVLADRNDRLERLSSVARHGPASGAVRYELAMLDDLRGEPLAALRLHARTVAENPRFRRGQYRLGMSLVMAGGDALAGRWEPQRLDRDHVDIATYLQRAGMTIDPVAESADAADVWRHRRRLLELGERQLAGYRRTLRLGTILWTSLVRRDERGPWMPVIKSRRARKQASAVADTALLLCRARRDDLEGRLATSRYLRRARSAADALLAPGGPAQQWQYAYNLACVLAMRTGRPYDNGDRKTTDLRQVLRLLQLAADSPDNPRASEWLGRDPDLHVLHGDPLFVDFLHEQIRRDFAPPDAPPQPAEAEWFADQVQAAQAPTGYVTRSGNGTRKKSPARLWLRAPR